jgi:hypothetical protein
MNDKNKTSSLDGKDGGEYTATGSSSHYKGDLLEFVDNIERMFGTVAAYLTCESNVIKYRMRAGKKAGVPADKDLVKANWYAKCGEYLKEKIEVQKMIIRDPASNDRLWDEFGNKYGVGREYCSTAVQFLDLFAGEFKKDPASPEYKTLQTIVDAKLAESH